MKTFLWVCSEAKRVNRLSYHHVDYWLGIYVEQANELEQHA